MDAKLFSLVFLFFFTIWCFKKNKKKYCRIISPHGYGINATTASPPPNPLHPPPQPRAVALGKHPQFTAIRFTHHPNSYDLIWFNACFIQLLYNTGPPHYPASPPPSLSWPDLHPHRRRQSPPCHRHRRCTWQARLLLFWKLIAGARLATLHMLNPAECWSVCCRDYSTPAARLISESRLHSHSASKSIWVQCCIYWKHVYRCVCVYCSRLRFLDAHRARSILVPWNSCRKLKIGEFKNFSIVSLQPNPPQ